MARWFDHSWHPLQVGEAVLTGWRAPAVDVIGKLCTGAERWQAAIRQMQAPVSLADILRSRTLI